MQIDNCIHIALCPQNDRDLIYAHQKVYQPNQFIMADLIKEPESKVYGACSFRLNSMSIKYRAAHITPTKSGQFVTLWKRVGRGPIEPFDFADLIDLFVIGVRNCDNDRFGQFVFPKNMLLQKGIVSTNGRGGKRAIRVYCPWDVTESRQAKATQAWQLNYFLEIPLHASINRDVLKKLYSI